MAQEKKTYPAEFKRRVVELVRAGRSPEELAREFEPSANTIRKWATQADIDEGLRAQPGVPEDRPEGKPDPLSLFTRMTQVFSRA